MANTTGELTMLQGSRGFCATLATGLTCTVGAAHSTISSWLQPAIFMALQLLVCCFASLHALETLCIVFYGAHSPFLVSDHVFNLL